MYALWLRGAFPRAVLSDTTEAAFRWIEGFTQTFLERDIPNLGIRIPARYDSCTSAMVREPWKTASEVTEGLRS